MARLVGVGLHNVHNLRRLQLLSSPCPAASREFPDSGQDVKRWFGETAVLEEFYNSTSPSKEAFGVNKTVNANPGQSLKKHSDEAENQVASEKSSIATKSGASSGAAASSSVKIDTEKLTEFIIGKFKPNTMSPNGNKLLNRKEPVGHPSTKLQFPQDRPNRTVDEKSNWKEVLQNLCGSAIKNKVTNAGPSPSSQVRSSGKGESDSVDDFADLDLPQEVDKAGASVSSNSSQRPSFAASFKKETTINSRHKEAQLQDWNQQKAKETKPINFELPKSTQADMSKRNPPKQEEPIARSVLSDPRIFPPEDFGHRVCILNLPLSTNLALVRDALSIYGEVTGSYKKPTPTGSCATFIEFKTYEAKEDALAARLVQLENKIFTILRVERPVTTVVRVCKVSSESTENHVLSTCGKFGSIDSIKRRGNGIFDVYYKVREQPNIPKILDSLNDVTTQHSRWSAVPAPLLHPEVKDIMLKRKEGQAWHLSQMSRLLKRIETGLDNVGVWFEDLKTLSSMEDELRRS